jgi:hypothetical protein
MDAPDFKKPLLAAAGLLLIALVLGSVGGYVATSCQRARTQRRIEGIATQHAERLTQRHHFDSTLYSLIGQAHEARRQANLKKRLDDSLSRLLLLSCLLPRPAISQVWYLKPGDVVRHHLVGLDTARYHSTMNYVAGAKVLLDVRAERITELERARQLADSAAAEVRRCRQQAEAGEAEFRALLAEARALAGQPPARPLLLDGHFYKGVGTGTVLAVVLRVGIKLIFNC